MRRAAGKALEEKRTIFTALQRNVNKENNLAEQHLIDMLCMRWVVLFLGCVGCGVWVFDVGCRLHGQG